MRLYEVNERFFNRYTEYSCYVLGYLYANGNINRGSLRNRYELSISGRDYELLETIKEAMGADDYPIRKLEGDSYNIRIGNKYLVQKLESLGLTNNKFENLYFPEHFTKNQSIHFIRGYFDGKGSFIIEKANNRKRTISNFSCGSEVFLEGLRDRLYLLGLSKANIHKGGASKATNYIRYYINDTRKLARLLYTDARIYSREQRGRYDIGT